jgi:hypothetical protein
MQSKMRLRILYITFLAGNIGGSGHRWSLVVGCRGRSVRGCLLGYSLTF